MSDTMNDYFKDYYVTERRWVENGCYGEWVCAYCGCQTKKKYIATGHDHTDYSYNMCKCEGAKTYGIPNTKCI